MMSPHEVIPPWQGLHDSTIPAGMALPKTVALAPTQSGEDDPARRRRVTVIITLGSLKIATLSRIGDYVDQHVVFMHTKSSVF